MYDVRALPHTGSALPALSPAALLALYVTGTLRCRMPALYGCTGIVAGTLRYALPAALPALYRQRWRSCVSTVSLSFESDGACVCVSHQYEYLGDQGRVRVVSFTAVYVLRPTPD